MTEIVVSLIVSGEKSKLTSGMMSVPNAITLARLCMLPVFLYVLFGRDNRSGAAWLLGAISYTDWIDGWVAR
jgi:cardiolipin synthase